MPQQQTEPLVVPVDRWYNQNNIHNLNRDIFSFTQLEWMMHRKGLNYTKIRSIPQSEIQVELEKHYVINDLDIRKIQEQEAAGNYFLMSLYVNTMVFDKAAL